MNTKQTIKIIITNLPNNYRFFAPWLGIEATETTIDSPVAIKASMKMVALNSEIKENNQITNKEEIYSMNVFLSRILFCFFCTRYMPF